MLSLLTATEKASSSERGIFIFLLLVGAAAIIAAYISGGSGKGGR